MADGVAVVSTKTLPTASSLSRTALHPSHSLILLISPPASPSSSLLLYRTSSTASQLVWTFTPPPLPISTPPPPLKGLAAIKAAKQGNKQGNGSLQHVLHSPDGQIIAAVVSPPPSSPSVPSTLHLIALDSGTSLYPSPIPLPTSSPRTTITHLSWQPLSSFAASPPSSSSSSPDAQWALRLISHLPPLPKLTKDTSTSSSSAGPGAGGPGGLIGGPGGAGAGGGGTQGGVFGAKQAMLDRERAKEAQKALSLRHACGGTEGGWPGVVLPLREGDSEGEGDAAVREALRYGLGGQEEEDLSRTVLCVGDSDGKTHLYLGGSVFLGSFPSISTSPVLSVSSLPSSNSSSLSFAIHTSSPSSPLLTVRSLTLQLPSYLPAILRLSTALKAHMQHVFEALQEARGAWEEARRIGKGWLVRLGDVSRPHGITHPPTSQLHLLLLTGRPSQSLHDFLASKMNERGLQKWEQAMGSALERMRGVGWTSVVPGMERVVLGIMELMGWGRWPERFPHATEQFPQTPLNDALELAKQVIRATTRFQQQIEEEERGFVHFARWLKYEIDKLSHTDLPLSSLPPETRPLANFHPLLVSSYIRTSLAPDSPAAPSLLTPYLAFGLASEKLEGNEEVGKVEGWLAERRAAVKKEEERAAMANKEGEGLEGRTKRMKEELAGQTQAALLERQRSASAATASSTAATTYQPASRPAFDPILPPPHYPSSSAAALDPDLALDPSPASSSTSVSSPSSHPPPGPASLPALLHVLASTLGGVLDRAVRVAVGEGEVGGEVARETGGMEAKDEREEEVRLRTGKRGEECWISGGVVRFTRPLSSSSPSDLGAVEHAALSLSSSPSTGGEKVRVIDFDFVSTPFSSSSSEYEDAAVVVFGCEVIRSGSPSTYTLLTLPFSSLSFSASPSPSSSRPSPPASLTYLLSPSLSGASSVPLDAHYPPAALAFGRGASGAEEGDGKGKGTTAVVVATLGGEGRRLEVLRVEGGGGEGGGGDVEMS